MAESPQHSWRVQPLEKSHDREAFDCGSSPLDHWLRELAGQYQRRDLARTYVAVRPGETKVLGFYAVSNHQVSYEALPADQTKGLPAIDIPVVLLGRLAVDRSVQGQGLGEYLLIDALRRTDHISQRIGIRAVEVHAIDNAARTFYQKYGFTALRDDPHHLFLPIQLVRQLYLPPL